MKTFIITVSVSQLKTGNVEYKRNAAIPKRGISSKSKEIVINYVQSKADIVFVWIDFSGRFIFLRLSTGIQ